MGSMVRVGMDVHQETIRIAVIGVGRKAKGEERDRGEILLEETIANEPGKIRKA